ncbi:CRISPR-associated CARF protein Csx1 [Thermodesulfovibrio hydrogeniphilus]
MDKVLIYQIGRLDQNFIDNLKFSIDSNDYETSLSSFAIKQYYKTKSLQAEVILLYPQSLVFNRGLINNEIFKNKCPENFWKALKDAWDNPEEYLKNPYFVFQQHPHTKKADGFLVIYSLGEYETSKNLHRFDVEYEDIVLMILGDMIERYLKESDSIKKIIVDISSGHNVYINALIEAIRNMDVWVKLFNILMKESPTMEIAFSDPILGTARKNPFNIYFEKLAVRAFFDSPVKFEDINNNKLSGSIFSQKEMRQKKKNLQDIFEKFSILFSAIKNNAPLSIYHFGYHEKEQVLNELMDFLQVLKDKFVFPMSPKLKKADYIKSLIVFSFYLGLIKLMKDFGIKNNLNGVEIDEIKTKFKEIYGKFNLILNTTVLGQEIENIRNNVKNKKDFNFKPLLLLLHPDRDPSNSKPNKRNFFAHSGLETNVTLCKKENEKIYLKYDEQKEEIIKRWLQENI